MNEEKSLKQFQLTGNKNSKESLDYGKQIVSKVDSFIHSGYFQQRNNRFNINERMASGRMDFDNIKAIFDMASKKTDYQKIIWKSIMIVNTIISRLVGRWMQTKEKAIVKAVDKISIKAKQEKVSEAEFYLENKDALSEIQQQSGVPMIPKDQFVPDDKDHLDIWSKYELYLPEEYLYKKEINQVLESNGFGMTGHNRRRLKHNSATVGFVGTYTWADKNGKIHVDWVKPSSAFYSASEYDDFRDCSWMGHSVSKKLTEIRDEYNDLAEEELFQIAQTAVEWQASGLNTQYNSDWGNALSRPYDDWNVTVVTFELKTLDSDNYNMKVTSNGNLLVEKGDNSSLNGNVSRETKTRWKIYQGIYINKSKTILKWGIKENPVTPQDPKYIAEAEFSYSYYMYQNVGMRNLAIPEKIEEPVEQMIVVRLKIQQLVANMRAAGLLIDVDGAQEIDLGTGDGMLKPMELKRVYNQTGDFYYRGKDAEGNRIENPIRELPNAGSVAQLQELVTLYNFHLQVVRDETGINETAEGQTAKPRTTNDAVQTAMEVSFNAVDYMNDACLAVMESTCKKIACLLHDSVEFDSESYRGIMEEKDVKNRVYDVAIQMLPDQDDINMLMQEVMQFVAQSPNFVMYVNILKIKQIAQDDLNLAAIYFRRAQQKAIKGQQEQSAQMQQQNGMIQAQTAQQAAQQEQQLEAMKQEHEKLIYAEKQKEISITGLWALWQKGVPLPAEAKPLENEIVQNILLPLFAQNMANAAQAAQAPAPQQEQEAQQEPAAQEQAEPQQMQQQEQGQPMPSQ